MEGAIEKSNWFIDMIRFYAAVYWGNRLESSWSRVIGIWRGGLDEGRRVRVICPVALLIEKGRAPPQSEVQMLSKFRHPNLVWNSEMAMRTDVLDIKLEFNFLICLICDLCWLCNGDDPGNFARLGETWFQSLPHIRAAFWWWLLPTPPEEFCSCNYEWKIPHVTKQWPPRKNGHVWSR